MNAKKKLLAALAALAVILPLVYFAGLVCELEYPYFFAIRQAQAATAPSGTPAKVLLARAFPGSPLHWHVCSYCAREACPAGKLLQVQVEVRRQPTVFLHFAFDAAFRQITPLTARTAELVPEFLPPGDRLVPLGGGLGDGDTFVIPASWYRPGGPGGPGGAPKSL